MPEGAPRGRGRQKGTEQGIGAGAEGRVLRSRDRPKGGTTQNIEMGAEDRVLRGRGRPKSSTKQTASMDAGKDAARPIGRPKGSSKQTASTGAEQDAAKPRGRPKGSIKQGTGKGATKSSKQTASTAAKTSTSKNQTSSSIVGSYVISSEEIEDQWDGGDLTMDIMSPIAPGIYPASFDFRVLEGIMLLSADEARLSAHIRGLETDESDDEEDSDEDEDEDEDEPDARAGTKRKASGSGSGKAPKKAKTAATKSLPTKFYLQWRGRETGEGEIQMGEHTGTIQFTGKNYTKFSGDMDMVFVGDDEFKGRKISNFPKRSDESWSDYSDSRHERERVGRWR